MTTKTDSVNWLNYLKRKRQRSHRSPRTCETTIKFCWTDVYQHPHIPYPTPPIYKNLKPTRMLFAARSLRIMPKSPLNKSLVTSAGQGLHTHIVAASGINGRKLCGKIRHGFIPSLLITFNSYDAGINTFWEEICGITRSLSLVAAVEPGKYFTLYLKNSRHAQLARAF